MKNEKSLIGTCGDLILAFVELLIVTAKNAQLEERERREIRKLQVWNRL